MWNINVLLAGFLNSAENRHEAFDFYEHYLNSAQYALGKTWIQMLLDVLR